VLGTTRGDVLTIGVVLAIFLRRAASTRCASRSPRHNVTETRPWWLLKLESIAYVLIAAVALLALGFLIVLAPLAFATALKYAPWLVLQESRSPLRATPSPHRDRDRARGGAQWLPGGKAPFRRHRPRRHRDVGVMAWYPASISDAIWPSSPTTM